MIDKSPLESLGWEPPAGLTTFLGKPLPPERDLFLRPPTELGPIVAAWSDVKVGQVLWKLWMKLAFSGITLTAGILVLRHMTDHTVPHAKPGLAEVIVFMSALCVPILCIAYSFKRKFLGYLSEDGAAIYQTRGTRGDAWGEVVKFADIANIEFTEKRKGKGWTEWKMQCVDGQGNRIMTQKGAYKRFAGKVVPNTSTFVMAAAIQACWKTRASQPN